MCLFNFWPFFSLHTHAASVTQGWQATPKFNKLCDSGSFVVLHVKQCEIGSNEILVPIRVTFWAYFEEINIQ